jgi:hypothetical protein
MTAKTARKTALLVAKLAVSVALLLYLLSKTDVAALLRRVRRADPLLLGLAAVLYVVVLAISTWRWRLLLKAQGYPAPLRHLSASYLVATFFNNFLPSNIGGDLIRVRDGRLFTGSLTTSLAIVATGLARVPWAQERFETVQSAVHVYRQEVGAVWAAFAGSVALQSFIVLFFYCVARALEIRLPVTACFLMVPLCGLIQSVPISFNGWGVRESVFILYFAQIGLPRDSALAFSLVGAGLTVLLSLSGAVVWTSRGPVPSAEPGPPSE